MKDRPNKSRYLDTMRTVTKDVPQDVPTKLSASSTVGCNVPKTESHGMIYERHMVRSGLKMAIGDDDDDVCEVK